MYTKKDSERMAEYYKRRKLRPEYQCLECGKGISQRAKRCAFCERMRRRPPPLQGLPNNKGIDSNGYIRIKINGKWIPEHRYIWENYYGKSIPAGWHVHHLDGNKFNNDIHNLYACSNSDHHSTRFISVLQKRIYHLEIELSTLKARPQLGFLEK